MNTLYTLWEAIKTGVAPWEDEIENNDEFVVYKDKYPVTETGHFLVVPKKNTNQEIEKAVLTSDNAAKYLEGKTPKKVIVVPGKIVNIVL